MKNFKKDAKFNNFKICEPVFVEHNYTVSHKSLSLDKKCVIIVASDESSREVIYVNFNDKELISYGVNNDYTFYCDENEFMFNFNDDVRLKVQNTISEQEFNQNPKVKKCNFKYSDIKKYSDILKVLVDNR